MSFFKRNATKSLFGSKPKKGSDVPRSLPSYVDQDQEQGTTDTNVDKKANQANDDQLAAEAGQEKEDETKDVNPTKPTGKKVVKDNVAKVRINAGPSSSGPNRFYQALWSETTQYRLFPIKFGTHAYFIPNAMALQRMLEIAVPLVARSNWIQKQESTFNPYAAATGYFYIYYIQILRAKKAASDLAGQESSALTRFEKYNPFESIPIPGFLVPFFESIVATRMEDMKYNWIIPTWGFPAAGTDADWPAYAGTANMTVTAADYLRPNIPFMLANLATFGAQEQATGLYNHMDQSRTFVPVDFEDRSDPTNVTRRTRVRFLNAVNNMTTAGAHGTTQTITSCGASFPFQFWNDNYTDARNYIADSNFYIRNGINLAITNRSPYHATNTTPFTNPVTERPMVETVPLDKIDRYLFVAKENNPIWFEYILEQMTLFAKHFPEGQKTLADIATTGGLESTIIGQLKFEEPLTAGGTDHVYQDVYCGKANDNIRFYPKLFRDVTASFVTTRNDVETNEVHQAFAIAINSNPPVVVDNNTKLREGKFFTQTLTDRTVINQYIGDMSLTSKGEVPMFINWNDYVRDSFVLKPE